MKEGVRQRNAWLHGWAGLLLGWLMFAIFLTGTISFFRQEVTFWMQPELHRIGKTTPAEAAQRGLDKLAEIAPDAQNWTINLPSERNPSLRVSWEAASLTQPTLIKSAERLEAEAAAERANSRGGRPRSPGLTLDPESGAVVTPRETAGGEFLYRFHYQLHAMPRELGRWIIGLATFAMFVAILSGIVTHKKIFRDFFTFRRDKGQRSWLDAHNAAAVLSLPFHFMITFSGLLLLGGTLLPWTDQPGREGDRHGGSRVEQADGDAASARGAAHLPLLEQRIPALIGQAHSHWGQPVGRISVDALQSSSPTIELSSQRSSSLLQRAGGGPAMSLTFDAASAALIEETDHRAGNAIEGTDRVFSALHLARFAPWSLRWMFFIAGVVGTVMVGTGLVLWTVKRAARQREGRVPVGHRIVETLNIGAITGLLIAVAAYFWANRLLPAGNPERPDHEIAIFFAVWLATFLHPLGRKPRTAWTEQLCAGGVLFTALPIANEVTGGAGLGEAVLGGNWIVAGFDLVSLAAGIALFSAAALPGRRKASRSTPIPSPA